ncbi:MAG: DUF1080 domain-containing protein [Rhodothermales bacterium]
MKASVCSFVLIALLSLAVTPSDAIAQHAIPSAFNGHDFSGWVLPENNIWWKAGDGILSVQNGPEQKGSILWTEIIYDDFIVDLEFKMGQGVVDSGVFLRYDKEQIQIGNSGSMKRDMTASPYIAGKGYPVEAEGVGTILQLAGWNKLTIVAIGQNYSVWLNSKKVMTYNSESAIEKGPIGLQLHANREMDIEFRNVKIGAL